MVEAPEVKAKFEAALEKARSLKPLQQSREKLALELGNLPNNVVHLQMVGKTLFGERTRIEAEIAAVSRKERDLRQEVQEFFGSVVNGAVLPMREKIAGVMPMRRRLHVLLAESAMVYREIQDVQKNCKTELDAVRKMAAELKYQTDERYPLPEISFPSPLVPEPLANQINHARNSGDNNIAEILASMANQIA